MSKIKTTGDLRKFLCGAIEGVESGTLDIRKAREIAKVAAKINENIFAEVKVATLARETGKAVEKVGSLDLTGK